MPRVTPAHEQAVRGRIVEAATAVFGELGYRRATVQDVVRKSGLSVGAVYNHFKNKEELYLAVCASEAEQEKAELRNLVGEQAPVGIRLRTAAEWAINTATGEEMPGVLLRAWSDASESAELRRVLTERRAEMLAFTRQVLGEAVDAGELPGWIDVEGLASAFLTLIDGMTIRASIETEPRRDEMRREANALLDLLLAAPAARPATAES